MTPKELRTRRIALGVSIEELAEETHLPEIVVEEFEHGERTDLDDTGIIRAAFKRLEKRNKPTSP